MIAQIPDWRNIDPKANYAVEGPTLAGILKICGAVNAIKGIQGIDVKPAEGGISIGIGLSGLADPNTTNTNGVPAGYTFEEFTICVDGAPETRWWPTWTSDPTA